MKDKSWIFVLTHGQAGAYLVKSAEMIMGPLKNLAVFSLLPGMSPEEFMVSIKEKLDEIKGGEVLFITDLYGGTPCNVSMALSKQYPIQLVCGLNLSMLVEGDLLRENLAGKELAEAVCNVGMTACCVAKKVTL